MGIVLLPNLHQITIGTRDQGATHFNHINASTQRGVNSGHFQANDAPAHHQHGLTGVIFGAHILGRVNLNALEQVTPGYVGKIGMRPGARCADQMTGDDGSGTRDKFEMAASLSPTQRFAWVVAVGTLKGRSFDWDSLSCRE